jgi:hypothetical protein
VERTWAGIAIALVPCMFASGPGVPLGRPPSQAAAFPAPSPYARIAIMRALDGHAVEWEQGYIRHLEWHRHYIRLRPRDSLAAILDERADLSLPDSVMHLVSKFTVETLTLRPNMLVNVTPVTGR